MYRCARAPLTICSGSESTCSGRCRGDTGEIQGRYMGEIGLGEHLLGEMQGRYTGDLGEIQGRYMGEMGLGEHLRLDVLLDGDDVEVRSDQVVDEVDALVLGAARLGGAGRCRGDAGEVQGRYRGDAGRCSGDAAEIQGRSSGDIGQVSRHLGLRAADQVEREAVLAEGHLPDTREI